MADRVLLVDDDADHRELVAHSLAASGFQVDAAHDPETALQALLDKDYAVVVTDYSVDPEDRITGVDFIANASQRLRDLGKRVPGWILATGLPVAYLPQSNKAILERERAVVVNKSVRLNKLGALIRQAVFRRGARKSVRRNANRLATIRRYRNG